MKIRILCAGLASLTFLLPNTLLAADDPVDFAKDIQPIFLKSCIECHGPEKQKAKLRLDTKEGAFEEDYNIISGDSKESEVFIRVTLPKDHDDIMPAKGDPLTKAETDLIKLWIDQGAQWPDGLVIKVPEDPTKEKDPRTPVEPSAAETKAITQLAELGVQVRPVAQNVSWTTANFRSVDTNRTAEAIALLAQIKTLEDLNLAGVELADEHLKSLSELVNLTHLHLEKTPVTDAGLAHLKNLVNLKYLNLYDTAVSDAGLAHLKGLTRLKNLYLWQTKVTDEGADQLQAALPKTRINRGWELTAMAKKIEEEKKAAEEKKRKEAEKKKAAEAKKKAEEEAKKKAEAEAKKNAEAEAKQKEEAPKKEEAEKKKDN